jgi:predicted DNA-binding protein
MGAKKKDRHLSGRMIRLPAELHDGLRKIAELHGRPMTWELRMALEEWIIKHWPSPKKPPK